MLIQLAGYLKGRAFQEWNLIRDDEKRTYSQATAALRGRLDPGSRIMAAQDFRHASQEEHEKVADFIRRLEQLFKLAYGRDPISRETRSTLLHGQLQEGLVHRIMESPDVSGATDYQSLCLAAKSEEKRLAEIKKHRQYRTEHKHMHTGLSKLEGSYSRPSSIAPSDGGSGHKSSLVRCWNCQRAGHISADCKAPRRGGAERPTRGGRPPTNQQVLSSEDHQPQLSSEPRDQDPPPPAGTTLVIAADPQQYLLPDTDEEDTGVGVKEVRVQDKGSQPQSVRVVVAGVPVDGVVDTAADITIVGAEAFKRIAAVAKLKKRDLKPADKTPRTYDQKVFHLDGRLDLDITFQEQTMKTPVYVKMDAKEQLLLSEGVCRQLGIVHYHEQVVPGDKQRAQVYVPTVRVRLVQTVKLRPDESVVAKVRLVGNGDGGRRIWERDGDSERGHIGVSVPQPHLGTIPPWPPPGGAELVGRVNMVPCLGTGVRSDQWGGDGGQQNNERCLPQLAELADQSMDIPLADGYSAETLGSDGSIQPGVTDKTIGGDNICECDTMSPHTGSDYHDPVAREQESLDDLSVLPYAAADFTDTTPAASRYSLRDRSRRKQPLRLMFTTTRMKNSSERTALREGVM